MNDDYLIKKQDIRNDFLRDIVGRLVSRRKELQITQEDLDFRLGTADRLVSKWECGVRTPTSFNLYCWAFALGMKLTIAANDNVPPVPQRKPPCGSANDNTFAIIGK